MRGWKRRDHGPAAILRRLFALSPNTVLAAAAAAARRGSREEQKSTKRHVAPDRHVPLDKSVGS